jgi:hypothetical protein
MFVKGSIGRRDCGIVLAGQGNRCAAAKPVRRGFSTQSLAS